MTKDTGTQYRRETVASIRGEDHGIEIVFKDYPVRVLEDGSETRLEYYRDFNTRLLEAIWKSMGDYAAFCESALKLPVRLGITITDAPPFHAEIRMTARKSKRAFTSELPDAVISALKSAHIGR